MGTIADFSSAEREMRLFLPRGPALAAAAAPISSLRCPSRRGPGRAGPPSGGRRDFLSGRGAEGSRCQPRRPPPPLPLGGGVSQPGGGRRAGLGFLSEDAQGSGRLSVCECVSVCRSHGVSLAVGSASSPAAAAHGVSQCEAAAPAPG